MHLYVKNKIIILAISLTILTGCGGGGGGSTGSSPTGSSPTESSATSTSSGKAIHSGQVKDNITGNGMGNVIVSLGNSSTITDANGFYALSDLSENEEITISFEKEGYLIGSTQIQLKTSTEDNTLSPNYLEYSMFPYQNQYRAKEFSSSRNNNRIRIDTSTSYIDTEGKPYNGDLDIKLAILDNEDTSFLATFPGAFKGINNNGTMVQFDSSGLINISLKTTNGDILDLADGETATLVFHTVSSWKGQSTVPLWYYDYAQGLWIEEGYADLQGDGTYEGEISHLGVWSLSRPIQDAPGTYTDRIIYPDGTPVKNLRIYAVGKNWTSSDLSTDENGVFVIKVMPGQEFGLKGYHYTDKYSADFNGLIPAIASGEIIDRIN